MSATPTPPVSRLRSALSYSWVILALACLSTFLGGGVNNVSMGVVLRPLSEDLGWARSVFAGAISTGTIVGGLLSPLAGRLADRSSPRWLMAAGGAIFGAACLVLALVQLPWEVYLAYVPARVMAQTLLTVVPLVLVATWFDRGRSRALGAVSMAGPLGSAVLAPLYQVLIASSGWRLVFVVLGLLALLGLVVPSFWLIKPRLQGARPRATASAAAGSGSVAAAADAADWSMARALHSPTLWLIAGTLLFASLATGSVGLNLSAALTDQGLTPEIAALSTSAFALAGAIASLVWGFLAERFQARRLLLVAQVVAMLGILVLPIAHSAAAGIGLALLLGGAARGQQSLGTILLADYFGRRAFGTLAGLVLAAQTIALGLGPLFASISYDLTGSYQQAFLLLAAAYLVAALMAAGIRSPGPTLPAGVHGQSA